MTKIEAYTKQRDFARRMSDLATWIRSTKTVDRLRVKIELDSIEYGFHGSSLVKNMETDELQAIERAIINNIRATIAQAAEEAMREAKELAKEAKREAIEVIAIADQIDSEGESVVD